jgi:ABC-type multidrug transport system fused ATPase/permease subunit
VLKDVSFSFRNCEKVAVIGRVGCGKSTLFSALLKEAYTVKGSIAVQGLLKTPIAVAEQNPLIISGTVRSNILYGSEYDESRYN